MRIGIDTFSLDLPGGNFGVGRGVYAWNLLLHLFRLGAGHTFVVFANRDNQSLIPQAENVTLVVSRLPNRIRPLRLLHEQLLLPYQFKKHHLDLIHFLGNDIAIWLGRRALLTVYDLMWKYYLDAGDRNPKYLFYSFSVPLSLRRAGAIITISRFIGRQTEQVFPFAAEKVFPVQLASPPQIHLTSSDQDLYEKKYPYSYIYSVTTPMPHKNLRLLIIAYSMLRRNGDFSGKLLVSGQLKGGFSREILKLVHDHHVQDDVLMTGFVSEKEKCFLYHKALLFVFPSLYEGFGLPMLEAMQAGIPVVAARTAALCEVGGKACLYFDPFAAEDLHAAMAKVLADDGLAQRLIAKGKERVNEFSWATTARLTLAVYEKLSHSLRGGRNGK
jgi:glycosyltransferase involved in cell wall biosynthesis